MSPRLVVLSKAEEELVAAAVWYEQKKAGLGSEFLNAVDDAVEKLLERPDSHSVVATVPESLGARRVFVKRFPYSVVFIERASTIWIVAFAHDRRRPGYWRDRPVK